MEGYLIYFVKVFFLQSLLFGFYWLINRKSTSFHFNRYFLLSVLILPFFIPLLSIPINLFHRETVTDGVFDSWLFIEQSLPLITISGSQENSSNFSWWVFILAAIYFLVVVPSAIKLLIDYYKIYLLGKSSVKKEYTPKGFRLLYVPSHILSFSFLNKIFLSDLFPLKNHEKETIVTHEEYHLTQKHSLDIILAELIRILCWFNPIIILIQRQLKETHEYLADSHTIRQYGRNDYAFLLKSFRWQEINMMLGNGYSSASIKNRLNMMDKPNHRSPYIQIVSLSIIAIFTAFLFACEDNLDAIESPGMELNYEIEISDAELQRRIDLTVDRLHKQGAPQEMVEIFIREQSNHPVNQYRAYVRSFSHDGTGAMTVEKIRARVEKQSLKSDPIYIREVTRIELNLPNENVFFIEEFRKNSQRNRFAVIEKINRRDLAIYRYKMSGDLSIHEDFDQPAKFKGGPVKLAQYLKSNMEYPEIAERLGIEDKVVLSFVVGKQGGLLYVNIAGEPATENEDVSIELQKAAFYAVRATSGMWEPAEKDGRFVQARITLPIEFKLDK